MMQKKTLEKEYYNNKLTQAEIADKYGISRNTVIEYFRKYELSPLKPYERNGTQELTPHQNEFMVGTMLGDGCLLVAKNGTNAWLTVKHSYEQLPYVEWKYDIMKSFAGCDIKHCDDYAHGKLYRKAYFRTICHPVFTDLHNTFYDNGVKVVTNEIVSMLTPFSIAVWFMDDGTRSRNHLEFATHSYTPPELERLQKVLRRKFNVHTSLWFAQYRKGSNQKMFKIGILKRSVGDFISIIKPYMIPSMMYKIEPLLSGTSETRCGAPAVLGEDIVQTL